MRARDIRPPAKGRRAAVGTPSPSRLAVTPRRERASDMRRRMSAQLYANEEEHRKSPFYKGKRIGNRGLVLCFKGFFRCPYTMAKTMFKTMWYPI